MFERKRRGDWDKKSLLARSGNSWSSDFGSNARVQCPVKERLIDGHGFEMP